MYVESSANTERLARPRSDGSPGRELVCERCGGVWAIGIGGKPARCTEQGSRPAIDWPKHDGGLHLTHNEHKSQYVSVAEAVAAKDHGYRNDDWVSDEQKNKAIATNECWTLQWYPNTPIGFFIMSAADLDVLLAAAADEQFREGIDVNPNKAFRKFGDACMNAPPDAHLTLGLAWIETKGWRVMMNVHTSVLHLGPAEAHALAAIYDKHHKEPEWRGKTTGLEWVAPELRNLANEAAQKNRDKAFPPEMLGHVAPQGNS